MFETCSIRPLLFDDLPMLLTWRNHPDVRRFMFTQHEIGLEEHKNWFVKVSQDATRRLLIVEEGLKPLGFVQFSNVCSGGVSDWGFYIRPEAPKGSGRKLGRTALTYAFDALGLHKVCGQAIECNLASVAFHKRLGFRQEGVLRDQQRINDEYHNLVCFGLLACQWQPNQLDQENKNVRN